MVVSRWIKSLAWFGVLLLNLFFIYFSMLRGLQRGHDWQLMYLTACVVQFAIEIVFYETSECAIIHYLIPDLARNEIHSVQFVLHKAIESLWVDVPGNELILNAPDYLFVSTQLANSFPELLESMVVRSYFSYSPGEFSKKWKISHFSLSSPLSRMSWSRGKVRRFTFSALTTAILQSIGAFSPTLQRVLIHSMQPLVLSGMYFVFDLLLRNPFYFIPIGVVGLYVGYRLIEEEYRRRHEDVGVNKEIYPITRRPATPLPPLEDHNPLERDLDRSEKWEEEVEPSSSSESELCRKLEYQSERMKGVSSDEDSMFASDLSGKFSSLLDDDMGKLDDPSFDVEDDDSFEISDSGSESMSNGSFLDNSSDRDLPPHKLSHATASNMQGMGNINLQFESDYDEIFGNNWKKVKEQGGSVIDSDSDGEEEEQSLSESSESWRYG